MKKVVTVCPYCASGCKISLMADNGKIVRTEAAQGKTNQGALCLEGCYGWDSINDVQILTPRLKTPMVRRQRGGKLEVVSWDEALDYVTTCLSAIKEKYGPDAIQTTGSSCGTGNETSYVMQKFVRAVIGTIKVDCCARVRCGLSAVGLHQSVGNGAISNTITEIDSTDLVFTFGYNPADSHPIVASHVIDARRNGAKIIVCGLRKIEIAHITDMHIILENGSNIVLLNAIGRVIIEEDLYDKSFIANRSEGFEKYRKIVKSYMPGPMEEVTGVNAQEIRAYTRIYASAESAAVLQSMGVTQFYQDVEAVHSPTGLTILTGDLSKPSISVNPVRGQNNVQGAYDMGALPDTYPGYQYVKFPENRKKSARAWGVDSLPEHTGYRTSELPHRAEHGEVRAACIMDEDPLQIDAELSTVRKAFEQLELIIVQDTFMAKTAATADVILPSTSWGEHEGVYIAADRGFQRFSRAVELKWDLKTDWRIISEIATRMSYLIHYNNTQEIWDKLWHLCLDFYGATCEKTGGLGYVIWPCRDESDADQGASCLFKEKFDTPNGLAQFFICDWVAPIDKLTDKYPMILSAVREVGHYSCRSMTGDCAVLAALADEPGYAQINTADAEWLGIRGEALVWMSSRKGRTITHAQISDRPNKGAVYMTYQRWIGACNELVLKNLSLITETLRYKYCAVSVERIADQRAVGQYVIDEYNKLKTRPRGSAIG